MNEEEPRDPLPSDFIYEGTPDGLIPLFMKKLLTPRELDELHSLNQLKRLKKQNRDRLVSLYILAGERFHQLVQEEGRSLRDLPDMPPTDEEQETVEELAEVSAPDLPPSAPAAEELRAKGKLTRIVRFITGSGD